jgi:hypothetical protein
MTECGTKTRVNSGGEKQNLFGGWQESQARSARPVVAAVFMPELANGDLGLAWRAVTKDILTAEELGRFANLLKFQEPSNKLRDLVAAVELRDPTLPHSEVPRKKKG